MEEKNKLPITEHEKEMVNIRIISYAAFVLAAISFIYLYGKINKNGNK